MSAVAGWIQRSHHKISIEITRYAPKYLVLPQCHDAPNGLDAIVGDIKKAERTDATPSICIQKYRVLTLNTSRRMIGNGWIHPKACRNICAATFNPPAIFAL
jgi:hypothetical protein